MLTASCGIEITKVIEYKPLVDKAIEQSSHKPEFCVVYQRPQAKADMQDGQDFDWNTISAAASPQTRYRLKPMIRCTCCTPPAPPTAQGRGKG